MAFGKVDHVINHVTGERKAITHVDLDKEYGTGNVFGHIDLQDLSGKTYLELVEEDRLKRVKEILSFNPLPNHMINPNYSTYVHLTDEQYTWNQEAVRSASSIEILFLSVITSKRLDSNYNPYYVNHKGVTL